MRYSSYGNELFANVVDDDDDENNNKKERVGPIEEESGRLYR